jgi:hypothetical protein
MSLAYLLFFSVLTSSCWTAFHPYLFFATGTLISHHLDRRVRLASAAFSFLHGCLAFTLHDDHSMTSPTARWLGWDLFWHVSLSSSTVPLAWCDLLLTDAFSDALPSLSALPNSKSFHLVLIHNTYTNFPCTISTYHTRTLSLATFHHLVCCQDFHTPSRRQTPRVYTPSCM